jgi:hypothetical protein
MVNYTDTTVKLDSNVVREVSSILEPSQTLTSYVRDVVYRDVKRRKLKQAATDYRKFLGDNPEEQEEMEDWEQANLTAAPASASASKKSGFKK